MNLLQDLKREAGFVAGNRSTRFAWLALLLVCVLAIVAGHSEIQRQLETIERAAAQDVAERLATFDTVGDFGGAAYDAFSLTWLTPSDGAFLAIGQRDLSPWMLRIRPLALEGQIYESDNFNAEMALNGRFDYAFVIAFLLPLFLMVLLYDVFAAERDSGRLAMLTATAARPRRIWLPRITVLIGGTALACLLPLWLLGLPFGAHVSTLLSVSALVLLALAFWSTLVALVAFGAWAASVTASMLVAAWLTLALLVPLAGKAWIERTVPGIDGAEISLLQRETVNTAWDLPKAATMEPFYVSHPEWSHSAEVTQPFHWKWYFAFQQMGDETAAPLAQVYRESIRQRDTLTGRVAWLSPPVAVMRSMQRIAATDVASTLAYEQQIRDYHASMRHFFYPFLFEEVAFERALLDDFPRFSSRQ